MSEWQPGDVGVSPSGERFLVTVEGACAWASLYDNPVSGTPNASDRRLTVIDPDDLDAVADLWKRFGMGVLRDDDGITAMQEALRQVANPTPPKPEEPLGLGAVVEAIYDNRFVRIASADRACWQRADDINALACEYAEIDVVRVLSEGIS